MPNNLLLWLMAFFAFLMAPTTNQALLLAAVGRLRLKATVAVLAAVSNLLLSVYLVRRIGAEGVILATILSFAIFMVVPQAWEVRRVLRGRIYRQPWMQRSPCGSYLNDEPLLNRSGAEMQFSVAMCTYNGAKYLTEQLQSLATQQRLPDELVICDDGSTDGTIAILEQFAANPPFPVRLFRNPVNLGFSRNFAQAITLCYGDVIALADQDDAWYPEKLQRLELIFEQQPGIEGVFSDGQIIDDASRPVGRTLWQSFLFGASDRRRFSSGHAVDALLRRNVVTGMALVVRRSVFDLFPGMPSSWMHDGWLALLIAIRSGLYACPERLVGYRVHHEQQAGTPPTTAGKLRMLRRGLGAYAGMVRERNLDEYQRTAVQFEDLLEFLERTGLGDDLLRSKVRAKARHARRGAKALERGRLQRWAILLPHLRSYASFSPNGLRGLPRDLLV